MLDSIVYSGIFMHENSAASDRHVTDDSIRYTRKAYIDFYLVLIIYTDEKKGETKKRLYPILIL